MARTYPSKYPCTAHLALPGGMPYPAGVTYLYAAQFDDGVVKIGATWNPRNRARQLQRQRKRAVVAMQVRQVVRRGRHSQEQAALAKAHAITAPMPGHREFFAGLSFADAVRAIADISAPATSGA